MATLIVFVDALPYVHLVRMRRLAAWPYRAQLVPGFGYSINLHAELFAGLTPDEVGFFGEWAFDPAHAPGRRFRRLLEGLDRLLFPYALNRGLQSVLLSRYRPGRIMPNLPLGRLADFAIHGEKVGEATFPAPTIFSRHPDLVRVDGAGLAKGARDRAAIERARRAIAEGARRLYVALPDLDGIGHTGRTSGRAWSSHLGWLDEAVDDLAARFLASCPDGDVFVVSDHGMADVQGSVRFQPERVAGRQDRSRYVAFTDSTLLRLWIADAALGEPLAAYAASFQRLHVLTAAERTAFGLTSAAFGDLIAVLDEGWCFRPSTFARNIPAAMHGYHPAVASQHAVLLHRGRDAPPEAGRTLDVFSILDRALSRPS